MAIDTSKVSRRTLRFNSIDEVIVEVDRLAAAAKAGKLQVVGNWSFGTILNHLATWAEYAFTGTPLKAPFFVRWMFKLRRGHFLNSPMKAGARIPGVANGTLGTEEKPWEQQVRRYQVALLRLKQECPQVPNVIFGKMTHEEWIKLTLRHAELHLSFARES